MMAETRLGGWGKRLLLILPILLAVAAYAWLAKHSPPLQMHSEPEAARVLETMVVSRRDIRPTVSGFGTAQYARAWRAVTRVEGRIEQIHPELRPGAMIQVGEVLLQIDASDYRSQVEELDATIEQQQAEIEQLEQSVLNNQQTLKLETEALAVVQREFDREQALHSQQAGSGASIDAKRRELLSQQKAVQDLKNSTALIEPQIKSLTAALRQSAAQKEQAERDVERTTITAPFRMRVGEVQLQVGQYLSVGETLFMGYDGGEVEIEAQLPLQDIHRLFVSQSDGLPPSSSIDQRDFRPEFSFEARVTVAGTEGGEVYPGRFLRVREVIDTETKMVGFVVGVTNVAPPQQDVPKPPLLAGAFCDVDVFGTELTDQVVIPRGAIRNGAVYLVDADSRLAKREVQVAFTQDDQAVIASGLEGGERLVIANPAPAIIGMLVEPVESQDTPFH